MDESIDELWRYIPLKQLSKPQAVTTQAVQADFIRALKDFFSGSSDTEPEETDMMKDLQTVPAELLDAIVPCPDFAEPAAALHSAIKEWVEMEKPDFRIKCIVGRPYSWTDKIITAWARENEWRIVEEPDSAEIFSGGSEWLAGLSKTGTARIVIPRLEKFYLRHAEGLTLIRKLMELLWSEKRSCLIGCDSWAWAYLCKVFKVGSIFSYALTLDAFDDNRCKRWFLSLSTASGKRRLTFRRADNHRLVLPKPDTLNSNGTGALDFSLQKEKEVPESNLISNIAAAGLGIPGVVRSMWRHSLQLLPETANSDTDLNRTLWVKPWAKVMFPKVPTPIDRNTLFVLHACLLHGGLREQQLNQILPLTENEISQRLINLKHEHLIELEDDFWRVTAVSYPWVRRCLNNEGYLID